MTLLRVACHDPYRCYSLGLHTTAMGREVEGWPPPAAVFAEEESESEPPTAFPSLPTFVQAEPPLSLLVSRCVLSVSRPNAAYGVSYPQSVCHSASLMENPPSMQRRNASLRIRYS